MAGDFIKNKRGVMGNTTLEGKKEKMDKKEKREMESFTLFFGFCGKLYVRIDYLLKFFEPFESSRSLSPSYRGF